MVQVLSRVVRCRLGPGSRCLLSQGRSVSFVVVLLELTRTTMETKGSPDALTHTGGVVKLVACDAVELHLRLRAVVHVERAHRVNQPTW